MVKSWIEQKKQKENRGILLPIGYKTSKSIIILTWRWILLCTLIGAGIGYSIGWQITQSALSINVMPTPTLLTSSHSSTLVATQVGANQITVGGDNSGSIIQAEGDVIITDNVNIAPSATPLPVEWKPIEIFMGRAPCIGYNYVLLPDNLDPSLKNSTTGMDIESFVDNQQQSEWLLPSDSSQIRYILTVKSKIESKDWIRIDGATQITVKVMPETINIDNLNIGNGFFGCGGIDFRNFPITSLNSKLETYILNQKSLDADAFSLEPGEFEDFLFDFKCESPGIYNVEFGIPYTYNGKVDIFQINSPFIFVCPRSYTIWLATMYGILRDGYSWDGIEYQKITYPIEIGDTYRITDEGEQLNLRDAPSITAKTVKKFERYELILIIDGPTKANGFTWWKVRDEQNTEGWIAENQKWLQYIIPRE